MAHNRVILLECQKYDELPLDLRTLQCKRRTIDFQKSLDLGILQTSINFLPDECLREILLCVPAGTRINLRRVSKKWREVVDDCWREVKNIMIVGPSTTEEESEITGIGDTMKIVSPIQNVLDGLLKHPDAALAFSSIPLESIATKFLSISPKHHFPTSSSNKSHKKILHESYKLKKLTSHFVDKKIMRLIGQKSQLQELTLEWNVHSNINLDIWTPILNLKNLRKLSIVSAMTVHKGLCVQLQLPLNTEFIRMLARELQQLESLSLGASQHLSDSSDPSDVTFMGLSHLKKLKELRITGCLNISGKYLSSLTQLEVLSLTGCGIHDEGVIELLKKSSNLRALYLGGTYITDKTVIAAIEETTKRTNGEILTLDINCTSITIYDIIETPPLLEMLI